MELLLDQDDLSRTFFYPRREEGAPSLCASRVAVDVDQGLLVHGYLHLASATARLLLFFHGNGELAADYKQLAGFFTHLGLSLLVMDYRGYGISDGVPSASALLRDAVTIFDALPAVLPQHGSHPKQIFVMGRSLGSAAACELASQRGERIAGLIIDSGFAFTRPLLLRAGFQLEGYDEDRDGIGNGRKIARFSGPTLIVHGQEDALIPPDQAKSLYDLSGAQKKRLVIIPNANHNNLISAGYLYYQAALQAFLQTSVN